MPSRDRSAVQLCQRELSERTEEKIMAKETEIREIIKSAGYEPVEDRCIIVSYAPENLSDAIVKFFGVSTEFFVLQICENELVLVPFGKLDWGLKKEVTLAIPFDEIRNVEIKEAGLNYYLAITMKDDVITLSVQQKELSDFRSSGMLGRGFLSGNWHRENMDATLEMLRSIPDRRMRKGSE